MCQRTQWPLRTGRDNYIVYADWIQGKIACANVLSDLYALGVTECDNMLMLLALALKLTDKERDVVVPLMIRGFRVSLR